VSILQHDLDELVVVQLPVAVLVGLVPELLELLVRQPLAQGRRDRPQLLGLDVAVLVLVKDLEGFFQCLSESEGWVQVEVRVEVGVKEEKRKKELVFLFRQKIETKFYLNIF